MSDSIFQDRNYQDIFNALGHELRLRLYTYLLQDELCVCELTDLLDVTQPAISQHLNVLKDVGLVDSEQRKKWEFYRARANPLEEVCKFVHDRESLHWNQMMDEIRQVKRKRLCGLRETTEPANEGVESANAC